MKVLVDASLFKSAISDSSEALSPRPTKNEWSCVHLETEEENDETLLRITCQDLGVRISVVIPCQVEEGGEALIPAKILQQYVAFMSGMLSISFDSSSFRAELKCSGKKSVISGFDPDNFARFTKLEKVEGEAIVHSDDFSEMVNCVSHCCSSDATQMVLTGVHFFLDKSSQSMECAAIDGFRLAIKRSDAEIREDGEINIPSTIAQKIVSIVGKGTKIHFSYGGGVCLAKAGNAEIVFALLSGNYVEYKRLIFFDAKCRARVPVDSLLSAVKFANVAAVSGKSHAVLVQFDSEFVTVSAAASDNESVVRIGCQYEGDSMELCFNGRFLESALSKLTRSCDEVGVLLKESVSPAAFIPMGDCQEDTYYLILPVRTISQ